MAITRKQLDKLLEEAITPELLREILMDTDSPLTRKLILEYLSNLSEEGSEDVLNEMRSL